MPYQINTTVTFIIDGDELNAGARAMARDQRFLVIDGAEVGTAGLRQFAKDTKAVVITGGPSKKDSPDLAYTSAIAITGIPYAAGVYAYTVGYVIDGISSPHASAPEAARSTNTIIIDDVPQETPP